jgi:hypothetical protein
MPEVDGPGASCNAQRMQARLVPLLLVVVTPGCATTSGREWLDAPLDARAASAPAEPPLRLNEETIEARPRLRHTVTLGEAYVAAPTASAAASGPGVQVNVTTQIPVIVKHPAVFGYGYGYGYGPTQNYGSARGFGSSAGVPVRGASAMPTKVGGDFPAPPDYGPRALR